MAFSLDFIFVLVGTILAVFSGLTTALSGQNGCADVRDAYQDKGFSTNEVPDFAVSGEHLRICPQGFTCCTADMEEKLSLTSGSEFEDLVYEKSSNFRDYFIRRSERFDDFFKELIDRGQADLRDMFTKTYGSLYQQNSEFFDELFENFRRYYHGSDIDLASTMEDFFTELLQRMFSLLNPQYTYTESFWDCLIQHTDDLKPFGDVPAKLTSHIKRAFISARTFVQGLSVGRDVITQVSKVLPSPECQKSLMRMSYCPHCRGLPTTKPCYNMCLNTMKGCLAEQAELDAAWNNYIDALLTLVDRLEGPVNIESVMEPIDVRISEAIMNMQENALTVTNKVFQGCGKPRISKRDVGIEGERARSIKRQREGGSSRRRGQQSSPAITPTTTSMEKLIKDVRGHIKDTKGFWTLLPYMICDDVAADVTVVDICWNGQTKGSYNHPPVGNGIANQVHNPEVAMESSQPNFLINKHITSLRTITNRLTGAFNGEDVEWVDTEGYGSGSGSGSGSGDGNDVTVNPGDVSFTDIEDPVYRPTIKPQNDASSLYISYATRWVVSVCVTTVLTFRLLW
ncbi:glypican-6-like [Asterias amurensis]|uniref:glypican-6-like n=1 Tax=Asterias amurensis TaxID=7602 RepID=UPI003AB74CC3